MIPTFLSELVRTVIIMSITGGAVILLLFAIKPIIRHRLPKSAQYYFWLVALMTLLIPISRIAVLPERAENIAPISISTAVERNVVSAAENADRFFAQFYADFHQSGIGSEPRSDVHTIPNIAAPFSTNIFVRVTTILMFAYPWIALLVLAINLTGYARFSRKLRKSYIPVHREEFNLLAELFQGKRIPKIHRSTIASTPMLIGVFSPTIILPNREYTEAHLHSILLHELTHMRRFDIAIKWLSLIACAVHWFNPLAWLARREIDRTCELSCDEIVIRNMGIADKKMYGNTLIDLATGTKLPRTVLSTTMCTEKRALKERLTSIMKSKRHTKLAAFVSMIIILTAVLAACTLGAGRNANDSEENVNSPIVDEIYDPVTEYEVIAHENSPTTIVYDIGFPIYLDGERIGTAYTNDARTAVRIDTEAPQGVAFHIFHTVQHIANVAQTIHTSPYVRVTEARIDLLEKIAELDNIIPDSTVELWRLHFAIRVEEDNDEVRWGTFTPDENGWVSQVTSFNDANTILAFTRDAHDMVIFRGAIPWWMEWGDSSTPWTAEITARIFFESIDLIPRVTFPGNNYLVYFDFDGHSTGRLLLSQPIVQGESGIWVVERWHMLGDQGTHSIHHATLQSNTQTMLEFFASLQSLFDGGNAPELTDPYTVARTYLNNWGWDENFAPIIEIVRVPYGERDPLGTIPNLERDAE